MPIRALQLLLTLLFLRDVFVVIARIEENLLVPYLDDLLHRHVEKIPVVRDQHERIRIIVEIVLEPIARFQIKMVRRFIQQQQVWLLQQQLRQRDTHLPAARKLFRLPRPVFFAESQAGEHRANLRIHGISIARAEFVFQMMKPVGDICILLARRIHIPHAMRERFHLRLHRAEIIKHAHALGKNTASGKRQTILRQISGAHASRDA